MNKSFFYTTLILSSLNIKASEVGQSSEVLKDTSANIVEALQGPVSETNLTTPVKEDASSSTASNEQTNTVSSMVNSKVDVSFMQGRVHSVDPSHIAILASKVLQTNNGKNGLPSATQHQMFNHLQNLQELIKTCEDSDKIKEYSEKLLQQCLSSKVKPALLETLSEDIPDAEELDQFKKALIEMSTCVPILATATPFLNFFCCMTEEFSLAVQLAAKKAYSESH